MTLWRQWRAVL